MLYKHLLINLKGSRAIHNYKILVLAILETHDCQECPYDNNNMFKKKLQVFRISDKSNMLIMYNMVIPDKNLPPTFISISPMYSNVISSRLSYYIMHHEIVYNSQKYCCSILGRNYVPYTICRYIKEIWVVEYQ